MFFTRGLQSTPKARAFSFEAPFHLDAWLFGTVENLCLCYRSYLNFGRDEHAVPDIVPPERMGCGLLRLMGPDCFSRVNRSKR